MIYEGSRGTRVHGHMFPRQTKSTETGFGDVVEDIMIMSAITKPSPIALNIDQGKGGVDAV